MKEVKLSLASEGLLRWNFFVACSDHAATVEGQAHQGMDGVFVWAGVSSGKLFKDTQHVHFQNRT